MTTYNLIYNAGLMVEAGIGYALCIDDLINTAGDHPLTFIPLEPGLRSNVMLFTKKYQIFSKATKLFLDRLKEKSAHLMMLSTIMMSAQCVFVLIVTVQAVNLINRN